jgi:hypothetical protein
MNAEDIFIGPLVRRAQEYLVVICLATFKPFNFRFSVKEDGKEGWLGHDDIPVTVPISPNLFFYFGRVAPSARKFPTHKLLAYSIGVLNDNKVADYTDFEAIVKADGLAYGENPLPTFFLQSPTKKLNVLYGSCRKIHDTKGGKNDALSYGDTLIANNFNNLEERPAILCLGGDQIYADDVDKAAMSEVLQLAKKIEEAKPEKLPISAPLPGIGRRRDFVTKYAGFTSGESDNHLVTFAEYLAMYGLMWNRNNWKEPAKLDHFTNTLGNVRRLLANIPSYMIFDDHDITDDWNLCAQWTSDVLHWPLGKRIVTNGLMAFWLCQGYGNDPNLYSDKFAFETADKIRNRHNDYGSAELRFWALDRWEFHTPTYPFIYFLDTRTQRGLKDGPKGHDLGAPAYLKSLPSWAVTVKKLKELLKRQNQNLPLVLVSATPVFNFRLIEKLQKAGSVLARSPYPFDFESWANRQHLMLFLYLMGDKNVVLLAGDVHYAFTSTVKSTVFDDKTLREAIRLMPAGTTLPKTPAGATPTYDALWTAHFLQLTSSALKNFASTPFTQIPANLTTMEPAMILTEDDRKKLGKFENGEFIIYVSTPYVPNPLEPGSGPLNPEQSIEVKMSKEEVKPAGLFRQRINDAFNSPYVRDHNLGLVSFDDKRVTNYFYTASGKGGKLEWNFADPKFWE